MSAQPGWIGPRSLLELWHPAGAPDRRLDVGGAAAPAGVLAGVSEQADFALVAPLGEELSEPWLADAIGRAAAALPREGVVCIVVPRRWRRTAELLLGRAGLVALDALLLAPPWPDSAHAVSMRPAALRDAGARHLALRPALAGCGGALARASAGRVLLRRAAAGCALLAGRPPAPDPLRWLGAAAGGRRRCTASAAVGSRQDARVAVVLRFPDGARNPDLLAKVALDGAGSERIERERTALLALGADARRAGAAVPALLEARPGALATALLAGRPASALISADPASAPPILSAIALWLRDWKAATAAGADAGRELLQRLLLAPAARLAAGAGARDGEGDPLGRYLASLRQLAERLEGRRVVLAAAHNDLTMSNVIVAGGDVGVVDWESAAGATPPLADLWYALADGLARARRVTHAQALAELVQRAPTVPAELAAAPEAHARTLGMTADEALLSFHACWLHHACNELERGDAAGTFADVIRAVAEQGLHAAGTARDAGT